jgi:hypothetical protein
MVQERIMAFFGQRSRWDAGRMRLTFDTGEQITLSHRHSYDQPTVLTARLPFQRCCRQALSKTGCRKFSIFRWLPVPPIFGESWHHR